MLDLFSGTGSAACVFRRRGYAVTTLDADPQFKADITIDIRCWDYKQLPRGHFDVIFAAPPCTEFSTLMTGRPRRLDEADSLVLAALEVIQWFAPATWILENPRRGLLRTRPYMQQLNFTDADYCRFAQWGYQKATRFWGSPDVASRPPVLCGGICANRGPDGRHLRVIGGSRAFQLRSSTASPTSSSSTCVVGGQHQLPIQPRLAHSMMLRRQPRLPDADPRHGAHSRTLGRCPSPVLHTYHENSHASNPSRLPVPPIAPRGRLTPMGGVIGSALSAYLLASFELWTWRSTTFVN